MLSTRKRKIVLVSDFDGPIVPLQEYGHSEGRRYSGRPHSSLLGVLRYLVETGVQQNRALYYRVLEVHDKHDKDPSYEHHRFVIDAHNRTGRFLHGLSVDDTEQAAKEYWQRNADKFKPTESMRQILRDVKVYGDAIAVSGSPTFAIRAYNEAILTPQGIDFRYLIGMDPIEQGGVFISNRSTITRVRKEEIPIVDMVRRMDFEDDKLTETLKIMSRAELDNAVVFGDTTFENQLFRNCGYPCMVYPNARLIAIPDARHYGLVIDGPDYIHRFREMLDFLHCVPGRFALPDSDVSIHRKIVNRFDRRIVVSSPKRSKADMSYSALDEELLSRRGYTTDEIEQIRSLVEELKKSSKLHKLQPIVSKRDYKKAL